MRARITRQLRNVPYRFVATGILSAALLVLSFPSYSVWYFTFFGMVPFFLGLLYAPGYRQAIWMGAAHSVAFILLGFSWISFVVTNFGGLPWIVGKFVLLVFSLFGEAQFLVFAVMAYGMLVTGGLKLRRAWQKAALTFFALPFVYVGLDFINPKIFPNTLGHVLYGWFSVAQLVEYCGLFGLTYPILVTNLALTIFIVAALKRFKPRLVPAGPARAGLAGNRAALTALALVAVFFTFAHVWGQHRLAELRELEDSYTRKFRFSVVQGNIGDIDKLASERGYEPAIQKVLDTYRDASLKAVHDWHPDLVIWPETSWPFLYTHLKDDAANHSGSARDQWIKDFMGVLRTPLFFGSYSSLGKRDFNSAFLVEPPYELSGLYRKSILLAFGEYVPLGPLSPLIQDIVPSIADFGRGPGPVVFDVHGTKIGPQICYEGIFPEHSRGAARLGADVLLNITNDSWFGNTTEPWLHLLLTIYRSIELRRPMIRSTNTGVSTVVDITGEMRWSTRLFEPAQINAELKLPGPGQPRIETFYERHGELFAHFCAAVALLAGFYLFGPGFLLWTRQRLTALRRRRSS